MPYRHDLRNEDSEVRAGYLLRTSRLLDGLDMAVLPFPDLHAKLSAARVELGLG